MRFNSTKTKKSCEKDENNGAMRAKTKINKITPHAYDKSTVPVDGINKIFTQTWIFGCWRLQKQT